MLHHKLTPSNTQGQRTHADLALVEGSEGYCSDTCAGRSSPEPGKKLRRPPEHLQFFAEKRRQRWGRLERNSREIWRREWRSGGRPAPPLSAGEEGGRAGGPEAGYLRRRRSRVRPLLRYEGRAEAGRPKAVRGERILSDGSLELEFFCHFVSLYFKHGSGELENI
jgi:hypothetical protein